MELRVVSAAAAVSWELQFPERHQGRQRCCQVNAGCCIGPPDEIGSRGTSDDFEVAIVGNSCSVCRARRKGVSVRRMRPGTGTVSRHRGRCRRCRCGSGWRVSRSAVGRRRGRRHREGTSARFDAPGRRRRPSDRHPRPSEQQRPGKEPGGRPTTRTIRGVRPFPCCVIVFVIIVWQCYFATELVICCVCYRIN